MAQSLATTDNSSDTDSEESVSIQLGDEASPLFAPEDCSEPGL